MIEQERLEQLHEMLNHKFWGAQGVRDEAALASALARPWASFAEKELYPGPIEKIAALTESLTKNHPFQEGNMRTAYVVMRLLLLENGLDIAATEDQRHELMLDIATSRITHADIIAWLELHTIRLAQP